MNRIEELEGKIEELSNELEKLKKEKENTYDTNWTPEKSEDYWYINDDGYIFTGVWYDNECDNFKRDYLKIFKTEEETKEYLDYIQAKKEYSHEFTQEEWKNENIIKYYIYYDFEDKHLEVGMNLLVKRGGEIYFKSNEDVEYFIDKYEKQIKKYDIGIMEE